jgi:hypothetical protein
MGQVVGQHLSPGPADASLLTSKGIGVDLQENLPSLDFIASAARSSSARDSQKGQGIGLWQEAVDAENDGCLIWYNSFDATDRGHGDGIYTRNGGTGAKRITGNIGTTPAAPFPSP